MNTRELIVPVEAILEVAEILSEEQLINEIIAVDTPNNTITIELTYEKKQRKTIHKLIDLIDEYEEYDDDEEEEDDDDSQK